MVNQYTQNRPGRLGHESNGKRLFRNGILDAMRLLSFMLLPMLCLASGIVQAGDRSLSARADTRFTGFDTVSFIQRTHPGLRPRAEEISHWAGYYNVNPILLAEISLAGIRGTIHGGLSTRELAQVLSTTGEPGAELPGRLGLSDGQTIKLLQRANARQSSAALPQARKTATEKPPAMDLPFTDPNGWQFNGVHTWTGSDDGSPMSSIDLVRSWTQSWGSDTSTDYVTAAHDGQVTKFSSCFVHVEHDDGWGTRYYHLDNLVVEHGDWVRAGDVLGVYANNLDQALCSGGHSNGPHVHFALQKDNAYHSLQDMEFSGYSIQAGDSSYDSNPDRMWLEKRGEQFFAFGPAITQEPGDNAIDYRYSGMWYSPQVTGHGMNIEITEFAADDGTRLSVFVAMYTYDDAGEANFYVASGDVERWRSDESITLDLLQTAGGDLSNLASIDFNNPEHVSTAGQIQIEFIDCGQASVQLDIKERTSGQSVEHDLQMLRLIGVPRHVCEAASLPLPAEDPE